MRGRWVLTGPLLLVAAMVAPALPLGALLLLGGLALIVLALLVANSLVGQRPPHDPPAGRADPDGD